MPPPTRSLASLGLARAPGRSSTRSRWSYTFVPCFRTLSHSSMSIPPWQKPYLLTRPPGNSRVVRSNERVKRYAHQRPSASVCELCGGIGGVLVLLTAAWCHCPRALQWCVYGHDHALSKHASPAWRPCRDSRIRAVFPGAAPLSKTCLYDGWQSRESSRAWPCHRGTARRDGARGVSRSGVPTLDPGDGLGRRTGGTV